MKPNISFGGNVRLRGDLTVEICHTPTGQITRQHVRNTITYDGLNSSLYLWAQDGITPSDYQIATLVPGTNSQPPTRGDTGVISPIIVGDWITLTAGNRLVSPATGELIITATLGNAQGNVAPNSLTEVGLLLGNGNLFARQIHPAFAKTNAFTLTYTWRIAVTA
jgi:hypothetical protein